MSDIFDVIHKTIYQFFDVYSDEEAPMSDKDKLLLEVNKAICNNIKALGQVSKTGHWIEHEQNGIAYIECSECSTWFLRTHLIRNTYCPNCGAKMEVGVLINEI